MLKKFSLVSALINTISPWVFFATFFATEGFDIPPVRVEPIRQRRGWRLCGRHIDFNRRLPRLVN